MNGRWGKPLTTIMPALAGVAVVLTLLASAGVAGASGPEVCVGKVGTATVSMLDLPEDALPLWVPFDVDVVDLLGRASALVPAADGAMGATLLFLHEPGDDPHLAFVRDGVPLGTGHRWCDDPWSMSLAGVDLTGVFSGLGRWGGAVPSVELTSAPDPLDGAVTDTRFTKGTDDSYLRRISFRTPQAPWTLRFDFDELIDQLPEDASFTGGSPHESKFRSARATLRRIMSDGSETTLVHERVRKHKTELPVHDADHLELWSQHTSLAWTGDTPVGDLGAAVFATSTDVEWDRARKLETVREGARMELATPGGQVLGLRALAWRLADNGAGTEDWAGADAGPVSGGGQEAVFKAAVPRYFGGLRIDTTGFLRWHRQAGWSPAAAVALGGGGTSGWRIGIQHGGRAPRSDELLTAERLTGGGNSVVLLPEMGLGWESLDRIDAACRVPVMGNELILSGAVRRLRDGIGWRRLAGDGNTGRWANDVDLDGWNADLVLRRAGSLAGWFRLEGILSARGYDVKAGVPVALPPEHSAVLNAFWEHHWFHEDGIFELGYTLERRGETDDPWLPDPGARLPAMTLHHLTIGFRLVGVDLGYELRNLTNQRVQVSPGAMSSGQVNRWRMHWTFMR